MDNATQERYGLRPTLINKVVNIGKTEDEGNIFCKILFQDKKLSISGVVEPLKNGDCKGSCGQMYDSITESLDTLEYSEGWDKIKAFTFVEHWGKWHLNDMNAGCKHQRKNWNLDVKLTFDTYELKSEALSLENKLKEKVETKLLKGEAVKLTSKEVAIYSQTYTLTIERKGVDIQEIDGYEFKSTEDKLASWVNYPENKNGLLGKPCEVCNYKYGTAWKHEDVPTEILKFLDALPATTGNPAWV